MKVLGILLALAGGVCADAITFENLAPVGGTLFIDTPSILIEGFEISTNGSLIVDPTSPAVVAGMPSNGTSVVRPSRVGFYMTIARPMSVPFSLKSIDAVDRNNDYPGGSTFGVTATTASGGMISTTFTTPVKSDPSTPSEFNTFFLGGGAWENVTSVTIGQSVRFMFDNVVTGVADPNAPPGSSPDPVPEPGTFALFGVAALGAYVIRRRRNAS